MNSIHIQMNTLYFRDRGELALRITIRGSRCHMRIPRELQDRIREQRGMSWQGGREMYAGPGSARINAHLTRIQQEVGLVYMLLVGYQVEITPGSVRDIYKDMAEGRYSFDAQGLAKCIRERSVKRVRMNLIPLLEWHRDNAARTTQGTRTNRTAFIGNVRRFLAEGGRVDLPAEQFTIAQVNRFIDYMRGRGLKDSTIKEHVGFIAGAIRAGFNRDYTAENTLSGFEFRIIRDKHMFHLESKHLQYLADTDFTRPADPIPGAELPEVSQCPGPYHGERMQIVADLLLFCCYTGFHYCDRQELTRKHQSEFRGSVWLEKVRRKTKRFDCRAILKVHPVALRLIAKYGGIDQLPKLEYHTNMNYLCRLGELMGLPVKLGTGHARNTFANTSLNVWRHSKETTAAGMGIKDMSTLDNYSLVGKERVDGEINW